MQDNSTLDNPMTRRLFLGGLLASAAAAGVTGPLLDAAQAAPKPTEGIFLGTYGGEILRIDSTGRVSFGTPNPNRELFVVAEGDKEPRGAGVPYRSEFRRG